MAANTGLAFDKMHPDTVSGNVERCLDACDTGADDDHITHGGHTPLQVLCMKQRF
jgi:hypothetical protein